MTSKFKFLPLVTGVFLSGMAASATTYDIGDGVNECKGLNACTLDVSGTVSSALIKFEPNGRGFAVDDINSAFGLSGSLFSFSGITDTSVNWTYTPGSTDPVLKAVAVKAGPGWAWTSEFSLLDGVYSGNLSVEDAGLSVGGGNSDRPNNGQGNRGGINSSAALVGGNTPGISHITFFGTEASSTGGSSQANVYSDTPPAIPLPAAAWLLLTGLGGLVIAGRRRRARAA